MEDLAYILVFTGVYVITLAVVMAFAVKWRNKMRRAIYEEDTANVYRTVALGDAISRTEDAIDYQRRANELASRRIRRAEDDASDALEAAERSEQAYKDADEQHRKIAKTYADGVGMISSQVYGMQQAANAARKASFERADKQQSALRSLERDLERLQKGAVTPEEVEAEVAMLERELKAHSEKTRDATDGFYNKVNEMIEASEKAQRDTMSEIKAMYATKAYLDDSIDGISGSIESLDSDMAGKFESLDERVDEVKSICTKNAENIDASNINRLSAAYDDVSSKVDEYSAILKENESLYDSLDASMKNLESEVAAHEGVESALAELQDYVRTNCVKSVDVASVQEDVTTVRKEAGEAKEKAEEAVASCGAALSSCETALDDCTKAQGSAILNLKEDGVIEMDDGSKLLMKSGVLTYCNPNNDCTELR